ncbi:MAG: hypothetical protein ABJG88_09885 [Litorimonas sp.]
MNISPQIWFLWTAKIIPHERTDWLAAMRAELEQIATPSDRSAFAFGCFKAALLESAQSRKGLSFIARGGMASLIFAGSIAVWLLWHAKMYAQPEALAISKVILPICLAYMCGAALLLTSLIGLKLYAAMGFCLATLSATYCLFARPIYMDLSSGFLTALSFKVAGIMAGLLFFGVFLSWLYNPDIHDA